MYKKILVPLDGSGVAERVLPHAAILARATGSEVTFTTVLTSDVYLGAGSDKLEGIPEAVTERRDALREEARLYLEKIAHDFEGQGVVAHCVVREGDVANEIIACVEEGGFDLVTMATHGRSGIDRIIMGSIAEKVLRGTQKPVLLIRALAEVPRQVDWVQAAPPP